MHGAHGGTYAERKFQFENQADRFGYHSAGAAKCAGNRHRDQCGVSAKSATLGLGSPEIRTGPNH